jgi:hypothetical protein
VGSRDLGAVAGHPNGFDQPLLERLGGGVDGSARAECSVPFDGVGQVMQLPQVDVIDAHAFK